MLEQGEIVLVPVPFTDLSSQKRRPVIVLSNDNYNRQSPDIIVVAMTSNPAVVAHGITIDSRDLVRGTLNHQGTVRVDKIYALAQSIVVKRFAKVTPAVLNRLRTLLADVTDPATP
jgi:mRNA interferase MazF